MLLRLPEKFQNIPRIMNTNVEGKRSVMYAMTAIKGVDYRFKNVVCNKANIDLTKQLMSCLRMKMEF